MNYQTAIGIVIILAFASYIYVKWRRDAQARDVRHGSHFADREPEIAARHYMDAMEDLCGGAAFSFDANLRLLSCGRNGSAIIRGSDTSGHLIDILPRDASPEVLRRMVALRASGQIEFQGLWNSRRVQIIMLSLGKSGLGLIVIPLCSRRFAKYE